MLLVLILSQFLQNCQIFLEMPEKTKRRGRPPKSLLHDKYDLSTILKNSSTSSETATTTPTASIATTTTIAPNTAATTATTATTTASYTTTTTTAAIAVTASIATTATTATTSTTMCTNSDNYFEQLIGDIGELSLDCKLTGAETDAVLKLQTFFSTLQKIPNELVNSDRSYIISALREETIDKISSNINVLTLPYQSIDTVNRKDKDIILDKLAKKHNISFRNFLSPPQTVCLKCAKPLTKTKTQGSVVLCATMNGMETGTKYTYRCRPCSMTYKYDGYVLENKFYFYDKERQFVRASDIMFIERTKLDEYAQLLMHSQVSFESQAVTYNATFRKSVEKCETFLKDNNIEIHDDDDVDEAEEEITGVGDDNVEDSEDDNQTSKSLFGKHDISRKQISKGTWNYLGKN